MKLVENGAIVSIANQVVGFVFSDYIEVFKEGWKGTAELISKEDNGRLLFFRILRQTVADPTYKQQIGKIYEECTVLKVLLGGYYYVKLADQDFKGCVNILEVKKALKKNEVIKEKLIIKDVNFFDWIFNLSMK